MNLSHHFDSASFQHEHIGNVVIPQPGDECISDMFDVLDSAGKKVGTLNVSITPIGMYTSKSFFVSPLFNLFHIYFFCVALSVLSLF
tara:strand:- start:1842 stop:2102 length:261 start_codon:yes stop_codon:yes gene_type:complete